MTELIEPYKITKDGKRFYTDEQKREIIESGYHEGISLSKLARRYKMHRQLLWRWNMQLSSPVPKYYNKPYRDFKRRVPFTHTAKPNITFARVHLLEEDAESATSNQGRQDASHPDPELTHIGISAQTSKTPYSPDLPAQPSAISIHVTVAIDDKLPICLPVSLNEGNKGLILKALEQIR